MITKFGQASHVGALWSVVAMLSATNASSQTFTCAEIMEEYEQAIVSIEGEGTVAGGGSATWKGTGFIVHESGYVISNSHVAGAEELTDTTLRAKLGSIEDPDTLNLELIKRDEELDIALLKLPQQGGAHYDTVALGDSNIAQPGESICVLGYPGDQDLTAVVGTLGRMNNAKGRFQTSAPLNKGNSGGPVFAMVGGRVIALVVSGYPGQEQIDFAIPINHARYLLLLVGPLPDD